MRPKDCSLFAKMKEKPRIVWNPGQESHCGSSYEVYAENGAEGYPESFATPRRIE